MRCGARGGRSRARGRGQDKGCLAEKAEKGLCALQLSAKPPVVCCRLMQLPCCHQLVQMLLSPSDQRGSKVQDAVPPVYRRLRFAVNLGSLMRSCTRGVVGCQGCRGRRWRWAGNICLPGLLGGSPVAAKTRRDNQRSQEGGGDGTGPLNRGRAARHSCAALPLELHAAAASLPLVLQCASTACC